MWSWVHGALVPLTHAVCSSALAADVLLVITSLDQWAHWQQGCAVGSR